MSDEMLSGRVPSELKRLVDADPRNNQDVLRTALKREFGSDETSRLEMRLEHRREQRRMLERERKEIEGDIASLDEEIAALEEQLDALEAETSRYESALDDILDMMTESEMHVDPGHGKVTTLATESGNTAEAVIEDLKDRADERGLNLSEDRFRPRGGRYE